MGLPQNLLVAVFGCDSNCNKVFSVAQKIWNAFKFDAQGLVARLAILGLVADSILMEKGLDLKNRKATLVIITIIMLTQFDQ